MKEKTFKIFVIICLIAIVAILGTLTYIIFNDKQVRLNSTADNTSIANLSNSTASSSKVNISSSGEPYKVSNPSGEKTVCPKCGSNNVMVISENATHSRWHCLYCGHDWWKKIPAEYL